MSFDEHWRLWARGCYLIDWVTEVFTGSSEAVYERPRKMKIRDGGKEYREGRPVLQGV